MQPAFFAKARRFQRGLFFHAGAVAVVGVAAAPPAGHQRQGAAGPFHQPDELGVAAERRQAGVPVQRRGAVGADAGVD